MLMRMLIARHHPDICIMVAGFIDDVEFYFAPDKPQVEYRSASRIGESDGNINRKRIKALRQALEKKGWQGIGF